ncbi:MAG: D-tyrosyl-tRNA(Tyr) deacylase [bacterium]|nr:D-tyrosyl-tRNA(Tyr) deacylase [bacterium]
MRVVLQRVSEARVAVEGEVVGEIGQGLLLLCAFQPGDDQEVLEWMAARCAGLRVFRDEEDKMNLSVRDVGGEILVVSQFTLYGDCRKGRRPSFVGSASAGQANDLYECFLATLAAEGVPVLSGVFQAMMEVELINDGPVTLVIDREAAGAPAVER